MSAKMCVRYEMHPKRDYRARRRLSSVAELCAIVALLLSASASAQYDLNDPAQDDQEPSIRYFGTAKDDKGALLPGVMIEISGKDAKFTFVTTDEGLFRANLPLSMSPETTKAKCSLAGYQLLRLTMRPGPKGPGPTVQVDCVLRSASAG